MIVSDVEHGGLGGACSSINEIHDSAPVLSDYSGVRLGDEIAHRRRVPMIAASQAPIIVQSLLNNSPLALGGQDEVVKVNLESVGDRIIVDARGEAARADEFFAIESAALCDLQQLLWRVSREP